MSTRIPIIAFLVLLGCQKDTIVEPIPSGSFQYSAYDSTGTVLINGWFTLIIQDSSHISGEWHFRKINDLYNISGPQTGNGQLSGFFHGKILSINLNPKFIDNNVILSGQLSRNEYAGIWNWISFSGISGAGSFKAYRQ